MQTTTNPNIKWAQRKDRIFITIDLIEIKNPSIDIIDNKLLKFSGSDSQNKYAFELEFYEEVSKDESKYTLESRNIFLNIKKTTKGPYWPRLTKNSQKLNWIHVDWRFYVDEDEEDENAKEPSFGNEQNFPGFQGGDELEDEDDMPMPGQQGHVHGDNCNHEHDPKVNLDDLDQDA